MFCIFKGRKQMKLSKNFTLTEFTKSQTALRKGLDNTMPEEHLEAAKLLAEHVLQPVREHFGITTINSGYRGAELNKAVGGSSTSQHCKGQAADIEVPGVSNYDVAKWIEENCDFDQVLLEFYTSGIPDSGWVHVTYNKEGNRKKSLTATKVDGKTVYLLGLIK
jgi:zinc D-Ala-D-Ala carboxypeptidase